MMPKKRKRRLKALARYQSAVSDRLNCLASKLEPRSDQDERKRDLDATDGNERQ